MDVTGGLSEEWEGPLEAGDMAEPKAPHGRAVVHSGAVGDKVGGCRRH